MKIAVTDKVLALFAVVAVDDKPAYQATVVSMSASKQQIKLQLEDQVVVELGFTDGTKTYQAGDKLILDATGEVIRVETTVVEPVKTTAASGCSKAQAIACGAVAVGSSLAAERY